MEIKEYIGKAGNAIRIIRGDCMELMNSGKVWDLAIVDPPYGININTSMGIRRGDKKSKYHKFEGDDRCIPSEDYFKALQNVSENQIVWGGNYMTEFLNPSSCWLLWDKGFSADVSFAQFEMAWTSFSTSAKKYDYNAAANKNRIHPTEKPRDLYKWLLSRYAEKGDKVLDTHGGSMSHAMACWDLGFDLDIIELDKDYYKQAVERFEYHIKQLTLF